MFERASDWYAKQFPPLLFSLFLCSYFFLEDLDKIRNICQKFQDHIPNQHRFLVWRLFLHVLPVQQELWGFAGEAILAETQDLLDALAAVDPQCFVERRCSPDPSSCSPRSSPSPPSSPSSPLTNSFEALLRCPDADPRVDPAKLMPHLFALSQPPSSLSSFPQPPSLSPLSPHPASSEQQFPWQAETARLLVAAFNVDQPQLFFCYRSLLLFRAHELARDVAVFVALLPSALPRLHERLLRLDLDPASLARGWLSCKLLTLLPEQQILLVWERYLISASPGLFLCHLCLAVLASLERRALEKTTASELVNFLSSANKAGLLDQRKLLKLLTEAEQEASRHIAATTLSLSSSSSPPPPAAASSLSSLKPSSSAVKAV